MKLADMKIGKRLALGFALVLIVVAIAITASIMKLNEVKKNAEQVKDETLPHLIAAYEVDVNTIEISDILTDAIASNNLAGLKEAEKNAEVVREGLNKFKEMFKRENDAVGYQETVELEAAFERWYKEARNVTETYAANAGAERNQALAALDETREKLIQRVEKLQSAQVEEAEKNSAYVASAARNTTSLLLILGSLSIIIGIFISFFITRSIAEPVRELCDVAEKLALGDVEVKVAVKSQDEIGILSDAFVRMAGNVKEAALAAERVAAGDLSVQLAMKSDADILAKSIRTMVGNLQGVIAEVGMLTEAAVAGKLATRGKAGTFHGGFREIIEGLNGTLDAVIGPLTVAANYVDRISKGDMPPKISETYQGDFNLIKENLNVLIDAMNKISALAREVADGNLMVEVKARSDKDELMRSLADMVSNLQNIVGNVRYGSELIASATRQISAGNSDLSQRTEEQASALEETAASMEELTSTVKQNAENAQHANQLVMNANLVADKGGDVVKRVVVTMDSISESSRKIADIIGVIDGIAFQTNILALNAAVEAARAGEQGRGFAVVAGEVRNLAQRSAAAAKEIKALIIDSTDKVDGGAKLVAEAGQTIDDIVRSVKKVTDIMSEITAASVEQSRGIEQVNQAITQMDEVTQQNASLVEEAAAAAEALEEQAQTLVAAVKKFKVSGSEWDVPAHDVVHDAGKQGKKPLFNNLQKKQKIGAQHPAAAAPRQAKTSTDSDPAHHEWKEF